MYSQECRSIEWQEIFNIVTTGTLAENTEKYRYYKSCKYNPQNEAFRLSITNRIIS